MVKGAWVTLATNDSYSLGALVLAHSLKQVGTGKELAVLITPGVTNSMRARLAEVFNTVKEVNILDSRDKANLKLLQRPELGITFTKLHCWQLTDYEKCVFLDADTMVLQNCDELFDREELSAAPDVGWPDCFNSGVFVYKPSEETYNNLIQFALDKGSFDGGDQGLLNLYFSDWAHKDISKHLPFIYNVCSTAFYSYLPAFKQFGKDVKIVHFIGNAKPWLQYFDTESKRVRPSRDLGHLEAILQMWWNIFCSMIHPNLTSDMSGLAGAFARLTLGQQRTPEQEALEDSLRRQNWEQGNIDYLGRDSFDNIWSKICETLAKGPQEDEDNSAQIRTEDSAVATSPTETSIEQEISVSPQGIPSDNKTGEDTPIIHSIPSEDPPTKTPSTQEHTPPSTQEHTPPSTQEHTSPSTQEHTPPSTQEQPPPSFESCITQVSDGDKPAKETSTQSLEQLSLPKETSTSSPETDPSLNIGSTQKILEEKTSSETHVPLKDESSVIKQSTPVVSEAIASCPLTPQAEVSKQETPSEIPPTQPSVDSVSDISAPETNKTEEKIVSSTETPIESAKPTVPSEQTSKIEPPPQIPPCPQSLETPSAQVTVPETLISEETCALKKVPVDTKSSDGAQKAAIPLGAPEEASKPTEVLKSKDSSNIEQTCQASSEQKCPAPVSCTKAEAPKLEQSSVVSSEQTSVDKECALPKAGVPESPKPKQARADVATAEKTSVPPTLEVSKEVETSSKVPPQVKSESTVPPTATVAKNASDEPPPPIQAPPRKNGNKKNQNKSKK